MIGGGERGGGRWRGSIAAQRRVLSHSTALLLLYLNRAGSLRCQNPSILRVFCTPNFIFGGARNPPRDGASENIYTFTFTFRAFSRPFYPKRLTISTFVIRSETIYRRRYSRDVHRTKCSPTSPQTNPIPLIQQG